MPQIAVIGHCGRMGCLDIIKAALEHQGVDVVVLGTPRDLPELHEVAIKAFPRFECKPDFEWRKERDYPTLREGIRRKQIKNIRR